MKVLHIVSTPRAQSSSTLRVSNALLDHLRSRIPDQQVEVVDLFRESLPAVAGDNIETKYTLMVGQPIDRRHKESWRQVEALIQQFLAVDVCLISVPMWNFSIPYALKYYIDCLIQPGYTFKYDEQGRPVALALGKKLIVVTSRGGDYSAASPFHAYDFQEPYLRAIFGFIGLTDATFINAQPMDISPALRETAIDAAIGAARDFVDSADWIGAGAASASEHPVELKPRPI